MPQLDPSTYSSQIFWLLVSFALLYKLLSSFVLPQIASILSNRSAKVKSNIETAESLKEDIKKLQQTQERIEKESRENARAVINKTLADAAIASEKKRLAEERKLDEQMKKAEEDIAGDLKKARKDLEKHIEETVILVLEKLTKGTISKPGLKKKMKVA